MTHSLSACKLSKCKRTHSIENDVSIKYKIIYYNSHQLVTDVAIALAYTSLCNPNIEHAALCVV